MIKIGWRIWGFRFLLFRSDATPIFCEGGYLRRGSYTPSWKKVSQKKVVFFPWRTRIFFNKGVELWKWLRMTPHLAHRSQEKWWYPWDGTLNNQPHIHLIWWVFIGSQSPFEGLQHGGLNSFRGPYPKGFPSIFSTSWWFQPIWRILVKWESSPNRDEHKKCLKPPPSLWIVHLQDFFPESQTSLTAWLRETTARKPSAASSEHGQAYLARAMARWLPQNVAKMTDPLGRLYIYLQFGRCLLLGSIIPYIP